MNNPFARHIPSVFVVCSPFQALCAVAAINQLEIKDYRFILIFAHKDNRRYQVINLMKTFHINYEIEIESRMNTIKKRMMAIITRKHGFERLFIGDYRNIVELYYGLQYILDEADVVYLDDGNITVSLLNNTNVEKLKSREKYVIEMIARRRRLSLYKNLLTIYADIPNPKYNIVELTLQSIFSQQRNILKKDVVVVGTNIVMYCKELNISEDIFIDNQRELMRQIRKKYPDECIIYVPHGRDKSEYAQQFCMEYDCEFRRTELPIELELIHQPYAPKAIYGFTSSALYNLKKIYPSTRIVNILYSTCDKRNKGYIDYKQLSNYYTKNGISLIEINVEKM